MPEPKNNFPFQADPYTAALPPPDYQDPYGRALTRMGQSMLQHTMVPGAVFQGVQPQQPGMVSDVDVARQLMLEQQAQQFGPAQAINMLGSGMPGAQRGLGAAGGTGGKPIWAGDPKFAALEKQLKELGLPLSPPAPPTFAEGSKAFTDWLKQTTDWMPPAPPAAPVGMPHLNPQLQAEQALQKQIFGQQPASPMSLQDMQRQLNIWKQQDDPAAYAAGGIPATPAPPASPASMMAPTAADYAAFAEQMKPRLPGPEQYVDHLKPLDWRGETARDPSHVMTDPAAAMQASEAGFNIFKPLFKGGSRGEYPKTLEDPAITKGKERGFFLADDPEVAARYGEVMPYLARAEQPHEIDWTHSTGAPYYDSHAMHNIVEAGHAKGADLLVIRNIIDMGGRQDQYVVLNPAILRAPTAKFDYAKLKQAMPLAGIAGGGAIVLDQNGDLVRYINGREREHYDPQQVEGIIAAYQTKTRKTPASDFRYNGGLTGD